MGKFIFIEGLDGSGKSTQIKLISDFFETHGIKYQYLHFPRLETGFYGELVAMFLRGEFGDINQVHPYLVTLLYAGDRNDAKTLINEWLSKDNLVLVDRYVYSNIAYQCAKLNNEDEKINLKDRILQFEYNYNQIPKPDFGIFLNVPFSFTKNKLTTEREGNDRKYLHGNKDIHEQSLEFQEKVRLEYLKLIAADESFYQIDCSNDGISMLPAEEISKKIIDLLEKNVL